MGYSKEIFVFGSNLAGRHGKGAAYIARRDYGAVYGIGTGLQGLSYAIPTKDADLAVLPLNFIKTYVEKFISYANKHPDWLFKVTAIGTGYAGYKHDDIGPMFFDVPDNCMMPIKWKQYMFEPSRLKYWIS